MQDRDNGSSFMSGVVLGAMIGAALGVLYAPAKGEETRKKLKDTSEKYVEKGQEVYDEVREKLTPMLNDLKDASEPTRQAMMKKFDELSDEVKSKVKEEKETLRKKYFSGTK